MFVVALGLGAVKEAAPSLFGVGGGQSCGGG